MSKQIFLDAPSLGAREKLFLNRAIDSGYVSSIGPFVSRFETEFASYVRVKKAVSTQSGTAALHVALRELGIGPGDEVIVPALTFIATVNPVSYVGATPVFADVEPDTWCLSAESVEKLITKKTKAIIPVHLYGNPCDMHALMALSRRYKLSVIEDATESLGATYGERFTGTIGHLGCFSFNGNKTITTGGGGMVAGQSTKIIDHIKFMVNQAREDREGGYYHPEVGFNYRMTNIEAALGLAQLSRIQSLLGIKKRIFMAYARVLKGVDEISFQKEHSKGRSSRWLTCALFNESPVAAVRQRLAALGIPSRRVFMPVTEYPPYRLNKKGDLKNTKEIYERGLCLPSSVLNTTLDINRVGQSIREVLKKV